MVDKSGFTVLDMFGGAGGLSEGFFRNDFKFIGHIEKDVFASKSLETRALYHVLKKNGYVDIYYEYLKGNIQRDVLFDETKEFSEDISSGIFNVEISNETEKPLINEIKDRMQKYSIKKIDVIIGGPPCQAYSVVGRSRDPDKMKNDPRNHLYLHYISFLKTFKPDIFIFENVPGITTAGCGLIFEDMKKHFRKLDYEIDYKILNASDFSVLQSRKRVILMGWRRESGFEYPNFINEKHNFCVNDLLLDLPPLQNGRGCEEVQNYAKNPSEYLIKSGIRNDKDVVIQHLSRKHIDRDLKIYRLAINKWNKEQKRIRYIELPEELKTHKNQDSFKDRFKVVAGDLPYSHTVVAHISKDGHYYIHPDINQTRSLTVREAARIQSFPDNYKFEGPRTSQFVQVGNAVPPLMAEKISFEIKKSLEGN